MAMDRWQMVSDERDTLAYRRAEVQALRESPVQALRESPVPGEDTLVAADTLTQTGFQREFGAVLHRVRRGEAVTITHRGRPDVVVLSVEEYERLQRDREELDGR